MKKIPLGRKDVDGEKLIALIDDDDVDLASYSWYAHASKSGYYAAWRSPTPPRERLWLHRLVGERIAGRELEDGEIVDHINRNKMDNRKENLRIATRTQNEANKQLSRGASKYRGVSFDKNRGKKGRWRAIISKDKKQHFLGYFDTQEEAALAYNKAANELFGDFAVMNVIEEDK